MKRFSRKQTSASIGIPLFEWAIDTNGDNSIEEPALAAAAAAKPHFAFEEIEAKCVEWLETEGHLIVAFIAGFEKVLDEKNQYLAPEDLRFVWEAKKYTSIVGAVLNGSPVGGYSHLTDLCNLLGVNHIYIIGLIHGIDSIPAFLVRKELKTDSTYQSGLDDGIELARRYMVVPRL